ncbi:hypothetical protein D3C72_1362950 [compost metagenome]
MVAAPAHLLVARHADHAGVALPDDKGAEAVLQRGGRVGHRQDDDVVRGFGMGNEVLAAGERPAARHLDRAGLQAAQVGACVRLGQGVGDGFLAGQDIGQEAGALRGVGLRELQRQVAEDFAQRHRCIGQLLQHHDLGGGGEAGAADGFGQVEAV